MKYLDKETQLEIFQKSLDKMVCHYQSNEPNKVREFARSLKVEESIFGLSQSDFWYYLSIDRQSRVLDVGCGFGVHSFNLAPLVKEIQGCDISKEKICFCQARRKSERIKNIHFRQSNIQGLPFSGQSFDSILVSNFDHLIKNDKKDLLRLYQLLRPGGILYFDIKNSIGFFLIKRYKKILYQAGFDKRPDFYIVRYSYHVPRFLIPLEDVRSLQFVLNLSISHRTLIHKLIHILIKSQVIVSLSRVFFRNYVIFIKK